MIGEHNWRGPETYQSDTARQQTSLRRLARFPWGPKDIAPRGSAWRLVKGIWEPAE